MKPGLYELIKNKEIDKRLTRLKEHHTIKEESLDNADSAEYLAQYLYHLFRDTLNSLSLAKGKTSSGEPLITRQVALCNQIISAITSYGIDLSSYIIDEQGRRLLAIIDRGQDITPADIPRPDTPLALGALLTGTRQDPSLVSQLQKEIRTSDSVDILCSFIKWSGIRILLDAFDELVSKGGSLRVITTSYMGATEIKAIETLRALPNTTIKISYDSHRTRLHAKAYLCHRDTGFSTAYIGSSNISYAAMTDGLEWNTKISEYEQSYQWDKITATFETYWNDREFVTYHETDKELMIRALKAERHSPSGDTAPIPFLDMKPYGFQQEILDTIAAERQLLHLNRHLIVAATGTGKTIIAAFDYKQWKENFIPASKHNTPRFLFIAHRKEILEQAIATFRMVLRDQNFGQLMVGEHTPSSIDQLFLSIQSYHAKRFSEHIPPDYYDYVIIDEFHHAAAKSYQSVLEYLRPISLIGLTATPERADGLNIFRYFDDHITAEIRLPDAIDRKLLCPFQYFGATDSVDYSHLTWRRGGYIESDLNKILTGNDARAQLVLDQIHMYVLDVHSMRGLGFCVSKAHAQFMATWTSAHGIPSAFVTSDSTIEERSEALRRLRRREINLIFAVDLYNEGVDIPEIDTVLFLRPTESLTVFLQQLGRGLRLSPEKDYLTVIDFVGQANKNYRFDIRYRALLERGIRSVAEEVEAGFPHLPAGCSIQFERLAQEYVLQNIRRALNLNKSRIVSHIAAFTDETGKDLNLRNFTTHYSLDLDDIYRKSTWSALCAAAEVIPSFRDPDIKRLQRGFRRIEHIDDIDYLDLLLELLSKPGHESRLLDAREQRYMMMFISSIWGTSSDIQTTGQGLARLQRNRVLTAELLELLRLLRSRINTVSSSIEIAPGCPLRLHSRYTRDEILIAIGYWDLVHQPAMREGTLYIRDIDTDLFFITLNKHEKAYSPTTMYRDYAISDRLFHWQSQSTTSDTSKTGKRYIHQREHNNRILLFVREEKSVNQLAEPYYVLGPADYVRHEGSRPISIVWELRYAMPSHLVGKTARMVIG